MKFLAFTDMHYSDIPQQNGRNRPMSFEKVKAIIKEHSSECDFIINLGDTADMALGGREQSELWKETNKAMRESGKKCYSLIGNHDTSTDKRIWAECMQMPSRYYSFVCDGYKVICLDPNNNDEKTAFPEKEILWSEVFLDDEQFEWLKCEIDSAENEAIIFSHELFLLENRENDDDHVLRNRDKVIDLFEKSGKVRAVFSGHYHWGDYVRHNGIDYITFRSICLENDAAHAVVTVEKEKITVEGFQGQESFVIT